MNESSDDGDDDSVPGLGSRSNRGPDFDDDDDSIPQHTVRKKRQPWPEDDDTEDDASVEVMYSDFKKR